MAVRGTVSTYSVPDRTVGQGPFSMKLPLLAGRLKALAIIPVSSDTDGGKADIRMQGPGFAFTLKEGYVSRHGGTNGITWDGDLEVDSTQYAVFRVWNYTGSAFSVEVAAYIEVVE